MLFLARLAGAALLLALPGAALAQSTNPPDGVSLGQAALDAPGDGLHVSAALRGRYETIANTPRTGYAPGETWWSLRSNLDASWQHGPIRLGAEITDARVYGARLGSVLSSNDVDAFEPTQLFIAADLGRVKLTAGRMVLNLGSRRLVASDDDRNTANIFTGARIDAALAGGMGATAVYVLPVARLPDNPVGVVDNKVVLDKESLSTILWGGLVNHQTGHGWLSEASFYHFRERDWPGHATRDRNLDTAGLRLYRAAAPGRLDGELEAMLQWGHESASTLPTAATLAVWASLFHVHLGYTFPHGWRPRLSVEFDRASGDGPGASYGRFDTLYGMRSSDFGPAGMYAAIGRANIAAPVLRLQGTPGSRTQLMASWRPMWLADWHDSFSNTSVRDSSGRSGAFAGHQFEVRLRHWIIPRHLRAEWDGLILAKGRFLREAPNAPRDGDTRYTSLALTLVY
jgi:hypothetical protein